MKLWTKNQIEGHIRAATKLENIMADSFGYIAENKKNIGEFQVQQFIIQRFKEEGLVSDKEPPIVAFGQNTQYVHYFPSKNNCSELKEGDLIMIDIWARKENEGMPFADITWMGFLGQKPRLEELEIFNTVTIARDTAVNFIKTKIAKGELPTLSEVDRSVVEIFERESLESKFLHTTGHALGFDQAHGDKSGIIGRNNFNAIETNVGYTIEPGLYFDRKFGVRSEIDFYISANLELVITSGYQTKLVLV